MTISICSSLYNQLIYYELGRVTCGLCRQLVKKITSLLVKPNIMSENFIHEKKLKENRRRQRRALTGRISASTQRSAAFVATQRLLPTRASKSVACSSRKVWRSNSGRRRSETNQRAPERTRSENPVTRQPSARSCMFRYTG